MATADDITGAIGCLSTVFPQFVAKELAALTDQIVAGIQTFTDPLEALGGLNIDTIIDDVAALSEGDVFGNLGQAAVGLTAQHVEREAGALLGAMADEYPNVTKRVHEVRNLSGRIVRTGSMMMSLYPDMPYAAAQRMCETIIKLVDMKDHNLSCLRKHIVQLVNAVMVLVKNRTTYKDETLEDLAEVSAELEKAQQDLVRSQTIRRNEAVFDTQAFERARQRLMNANVLLTPDKDGTSILDLADILTVGSVDQAHVNRSNRAMATLVIPSLIRLIEVEASAVASQVEVINHYVNALSQVISNFRSAGTGSRVKEMRARAIAEIRSRVDDLKDRIDLAIARNSLRAASAEMLLWSSRVKAIIATMDRVKELTLQEGSTEGADKAAALESAFQKLLDNLTSIENADTVAGIEDPTTLRERVIALTKGAARLVADLEAGRTTENKVATFHALAFDVATAQVNRIEESKTVASLQKVACTEFAAIDLQIRERYDELVGSMRQLGLDRAADLLNTGSFTEFLDSDLDKLSYVGMAINCLTDALNGIDDTQTRQQILEMRDGMIGRQTNLDLAAVDTVDQGQTRLIDRLKGEISSIQRNAKMVESIVEQLKEVADQIGAVTKESFGTLTAFLGNVDHLAVGAGGRLASSLESLSEHPDAGVVLCD